MKIDIESVDGNQMAAKIAGHFSIDGHSFEFTAIAFGRIGGQNIGVKLTDDTVHQLRVRKHDPDDIIDVLQRDLVHGNLNLPPGLQRESFADS